MLEPAITALFPWDATVWNPLMDKSWRKPDLLPDNPVKLSARACIGSGPLVQPPQPAAQPTNRGKAG